MTDFGLDISTPGALDLDPHFALVSGWGQLAQALARRILTPTGGLRDDPAYGFDVRAYLNDTPPPARVVAAEVRAQWLADERVEDCDVSVAYEGGALSVVGVVLTSEGTLRLVLSVSSVSLSILRAEVV